jgi:hypothetical protein
MTKIFSELISGIFGHNGHAQEPLDKVTFDKAKKRLSSSAKIATKELDAFTQMIADMPKLRIWSDCEGSWATMEGFTMLAWLP